MLAANILLKIGKNGNTGMPKRESHRNVLMRLTIIKEWMGKESTKEKVVESKNMPRYAVVPASDRDREKQQKPLPQGKMRTVAKNNEMIKERKEGVLFQNFGKSKSGQM